MMNVLRRWLPFALLSTVLCGLIFVIAQQSLRLSADDVLAQLATDASILLEHGTGAADIVGPYPVDMGRSLSPFFMIFDQHQAVVASMGTLEGNTPTLPDGALYQAIGRGQHRFTWEPQPGLRFAAVIRTFSSNDQYGFVLAARSLREVDYRISIMMLLSLGAWITSLILTLLGVLAWPSPRTPHEHRHHKH